MSKNVFLELLTKKYVHHSKIFIAPNFLRVQKHSTSKTDNAQTITLSKNIYQRAGYSKRHHITYTA